MILGDSIKRPTVLFKRDFTQIWINTFNPWIGKMLKSNMDLQFILDEYSCAAYCVDYVNKTNRGLSELHRRLADLQNEYPDLNFTNLLKRLRLQMLDAVEITTQEASWHLLRQPMSKASRDNVFIATCPPNERQKRQKSRAQLDREGIEPESTDVWAENIIEKYEKRPVSLNEMCLADFACFMSPKRGQKDDDGCQVYHRRERSRILGFKHYEPADISNYKRYIVMLFFPFRNEVLDLLDQDKFLACTTSMRTHFSSGNSSMRGLLILSAM